MSTPLLSQYPPPLSLPSPLLQPLQPQIPRLGQQPRRRAREAGVEPVRPGEEKGVRRRGGRAWASAAGEGTRGVGEHARLVCLCAGVLQGRSTLAHRTNQQAASRPRGARPANGRGGGERKKKARAKLERGEKRTIAAAMKKKTATLSLLSRAYAALFSVHFHPIAMKRPRIIPCGEKKRAKMPHLCALPRGHR